MTLQKSLAPGKYKLTVEDYLRLDETGIFGMDRTELLDGDIIVMNAEYRPHGWVRDELIYRLRRALDQLGSDLTAIGGSVRASGNDMLMPDISLTREPRGEGPIPSASVALVVEISSTTLRRDSEQKVMIYARSGIAEYWIVDINGRTIRQLWDPAGDAFRRRRDVPLGMPIVSVTVPDLTIDTTDL